MAPLPGGLRDCRRTNGARPDRRPVFWVELSWRVHLIPVQLLARACRSRVSVCLSVRLGSPADVRHDLVAGRAPLVAAWPHIGALPLVLPQSWITATPTRGREDARRARAHTHTQWPPGLNGYRLNGSSTRATCLFLPGARGARAPKQRARIFSLTLPGAPAAAHFVRAWPTQQQPACLRDFKSAQPKFCTNEPAPPLCGTDTVPGPVGAGQQSGVRICQRGPRGARLGLTF